MKFTLIIFPLIFTVAIAAPLDNSANAQILRLTNDNSGDGYTFAFETSDGISRSEQGELRNAGTDLEALVVRGSYSFVADDGITYTVNYIADENGYQPQGDHIPK